MVITYPLMLLKFERKGYAHSQPAVDPGQAEIQSDLFYDYRTNVDSYPKWQAWLREKQPRLLVIWGKFDPSFDRSEPEAYRRDVPNAQVHLLDAGHFALDTAADEIAALLRGFVEASP